MANQFIYHWEVQIEYNDTRADIIDLMCFDCFSIESMTVIVKYLIPNLPRYYIIRNISIFRKTIEIDVPFDCPFDDDETGS